MRGRSFLSRRFLLGTGFALTAGLALAPGAASSEEAAPPAACMEKPGVPSSCQAPETGSERSRPLSSQTDAARLQERVRAELLADGEPPVTLNGRGYNYETPRDPAAEAQRLLREAQEQQRRPAR
jgi:hypothetical protein